MGGVEWEGRLAGDEWEGDVAGQWLDEYGVHCQPGKEVFGEDAQVLAEVVSASSLHWGYLDSNLCFQAPQEIGRYPGMDPGS